MTTRTITIQVPKNVQAVVCDGPECTQDISQDVNRPEESLRELMDIRNWVTISTAGPGGYHEFHFCEEHAAALPVSVIRPVVWQIAELPSWRIKQLEVEQVSAPCAAIIEPAAPGDIVTFTTE